MAIDKQSLATVRHNFANAVFAHKVHEMAAARKDGISSKYKLLNVVMVGLVIAVFAVQSTGHAQDVLNYIGAGIGAGEILLLIVTLTFSREPEVTSHKNAALKYMNLRDRYRLLVADIISGHMTGADVVRQRDGLLHEYQVISDIALATTSQDYDKAMKALQLIPDGQNTWSDDQIDSLLPETLRTKE
jgi:hypothetical protein